MPIIIAFVVAVAIGLAVMVWIDSSRSADPTTIEQVGPPASSGNTKEPDPVKDSTGPTGDTSPSPSGTGPGPEDDVISR